jgi:hypothetical protein
LPAVTLPITREKTLEISKLDSERASRALTIDYIIDWYGDFLSQEKLSSQMAAKLIELLANERQSTMDAILVGRGVIKGEHDFSQIILHAATSEDDNIKTLLGDPKFEEFKQYRESLLDRLLLKSFNEELPAGVPSITAVQQLALIDRLAAAQTQEEREYAPSMSLCNTRGAAITDRVLAIARTILDPVQTARLFEMQAERMAPPPKKTYGSDPAQ